MQAIDQALVTRIGWTLMHTMWQGCAVALVLAILLRVLRGGSARTRYAASCAALACLVGAGIVTFVALAERKVAPAFVRPLATATAEPVAPAETIVIHALPAAPPSDERNQTLRYVVALWAIGVAAMALWHAMGWACLLRLRRGTPLKQWESSLAHLQEKLRLARRVLLIESTRIDVPAVVGVFRPMILVPVGVFSGLSPQQVEAILAHELAHVRRHDYLVNLLQAAVESLMFYHPATWWISNRIRAERENCCDDIAQSLCGDRKTYASALAALEERRGTIGHLAAAATGGDLLARVRRILKLPPARQRISMRSLAAAALAIACLALPLLVNAQQKDDKPADKSPTTAPAGGEEISPITPDDLKVPVEDYKIGPGDLLNVSITDLVGPGVETVKSTRVTDSGQISMPLVGAIPVSGQTAIELEKSIQKAYRTANLLPNAQVSVNVNEARGRNFSILGEVDKPGQYAMPTADFRVLDALAMAGSRAPVGSLRILRPGPPRRLIEVPLDKLTAGDMSVNLVIRPGDLVVAPLPQPKRFVKIIIGKDSLLYDGKPIDLAGVKKMFDAIPEGERRITVLEVAAAAPDVTVERFFTAVGQLSEVVKQYNLAYLSQTGISASNEPDGGKDRPAAPQSAVPASSLRGDEVFINGGVAKPGAYGVAPGKSLNVKQAIAAAGGLRYEASNTTVTVFRSSADGDGRVLNGVRVQELFDGKTKDINLQVGDLVQIEGSAGNEYYMDGAIKRSGVYTLGARKISVKQALAAAGGLDGVEDAMISVLRRTGESGAEYVMANAKVTDLMAGRVEDLFLAPNDIIRVSTKRLDTSLPSPATAPATRSSVVDPADPELVKLQQQRANVLYQLESVSTRLGSKHLTVIRLQRMLDGLDRKIEEVSREITKATVK